jgi:hypothetical protein
MKTLLQLICLVYSGICFSQTHQSVPPTVNLLASSMFDPRASFSSKVTTITTPNPEELKKLTIGLGPGFNYNISDRYEYSLSTDSVPVLRSQKLSNLNFVISSVVVFRLGDPSIDPNTKKFADYTDPKEGFMNRLTVNLSINMLELSSDNLAFNKTIDGGLGFGVYFNPAVQLALFFEISRYRQLRDYVVEDYILKPIPNGNDVYNALDINDNRIFYTATGFSTSLKLIFTLPNTTN